MYNKRHPIFEVFPYQIPSAAMNLFTFITVSNFFVLFHLLLVNGAPAANGAPKLVPSTTKISSISAKSSTIPPKSSTVTSKSSSTAALCTTKVSSTLASTATYPTPTVPIGAGGGPFATVQGRLFQIQSKTQYFAGMVTPLATRSEEN